MRSLEMNVLKIIPIAILLLATFAGVNSQETPKAVLSDEFGKLPCHDFRGRIDVLLTELRQNPDSVALVINTGRGKYEIWTALREEMIRNHVIFRGFDASRIRYVRKVDDEFKTQFLRIPIEESREQAAPKNYVLSSLSEPYVIKDYDFDDFCPPLRYRDLFATIIEQNPNVTATILVRDKTLRAAEKRKRDIAGYLTKKRKVDFSRIKMFLTVKPDFDYGMDPHVEYRILP